MNCTRVDCSQKLPYQLGYAVNRARVGKYKDAIFFLAWYWLSRARVGHDVIISMGGVNARVIPCACGPWETEFSQSNFGLGYPVRVWAMGFIRT